MLLKIYLLGQFKIEADNQQIELPSRPAQSLLAYLALNAGVTQRREKLASLLWPETSDSNARSYLRQALWRIRKALESASLSADDFLHISDISITFNDQSDYWLDAEFLLEGVEGISIGEIVEIICLYRGELLPGFYDEWVVIERDRLQFAYHQKMDLLLEHLIQAGEWDEVLKWGEHWKRFGYSSEPAYRALMTAYAGLGNQALVSATYQRCVESLNRELGLDPSLETRRLYEQILKGELDALPPSHTKVHPARRPAFLDEGEPPQIEGPVFVARERELSQLDRYLDLALDNQGRVVFITGEAGTGKTALFQEFTRRAIDSHADLIVASGNCNAHTGIGDPYLPFREILEQLTGDVEARYAAGAISREHARRLWNTLPLAARALVEVGPDLIDTFVPRIPLAERAIASALDRADWLTQLERLAKRGGTGALVPAPMQSALFAQYTRVLGELVRFVPLVLFVDDLQWADLGSISLLFHLCRNLVGSRILILGAYRPEEVALGRDGARHPLARVINELQREFGNISVNMAQAKSRDFVEALLNSEPNQLGLPFRDMLYRQTQGHPLFTIELLRGLQERGDLVRDSEDRWVEGMALDWEMMPARVEAVIAERINRLEQTLQDVLRVASVEGETFTAEVVARVEAADERDVVGWLSGELARRHRLVRVQTIERLGSRRVSRYRFRNYLFQKYLYDNLDEVELRYLHEDVGNVLEQLYGDLASEAAVQLAWHFQEAGTANKAIHYLHQAGERAIQLSAYQEAIAHLTKGLALLETMADTDREINHLEYDQKEIDLQLALGIALIGPTGFSPEVIIAFTRARELCQQLGKIDQLCQVLGQMSIYHYVRAEHHKAREHAEEALSLAQRVKDPLHVALNHWHLGFILFALGEYKEARRHLEEVISFYEPQKHHSLFVLLQGSDAGVGAMAYHACCLWCLGYPDQAFERSQEALDLARELNHPFTLTDVLSFGGCLLSSMSRDVQALNVHAAQLKQLASDKLPGWLGQGTWQWGESLAKQGLLKEGIAEMQKGLAIGRSGSERCYQSGCLRSLAEAQAKLGQTKQGLSTLAESLDLVEQTDERHWEAELHRLKGEISLMLGEDADAEACYMKAIAVARRQSAKSWELRATTSLARLWLDQGRIEEARISLGEIYNWFSEGLDTPDLKEARAILEVMSKNP